MEDRGGLNRTNSAAPEQGIKEIRDRYMIIEISRMLVGRNDPYWWFGDKKIATSIAWNGDGKQGMKVRKSERESSMLKVRNKRNLLL